MSAPTPAPPNPTPQRGLLIVIEGLDRSGKSSQCNNLINKFRTLNQDASLQKFPDRTTPSGKLIDSYLTNISSSYDDHAIHLLFSANRWEARSRILDLLASGVHVVVDRYSFSGAVYSAAKGVEDLGLDWAWAMEVGLPRPDVVVFLDLDVEVARSRGGWGKERYEREEIQRRVRDGFALVWKRLHGRVRLHVVDAGVGGVGDVAERVWDVVYSVLGEERGVVGALPGLGD